MRKLIFIAALALTGCGDPYPTLDEAAHRKNVAYAQEALCACLKTKTWMRECLSAVYSFDKDAPTYGVTQAEMLHAQCLQPKN